MEVEFSEILSNSLLRLPELEFLSIFNINKLFIDLKSLKGLKQLETNRNKIFMKINNSPLLESLKLTKCKCRKLLTKNNIYGFFKRYNISI